MLSIGESGVLIQHQLHQRLNSTLVRPPPPLLHPSTTFTRAHTAYNVAWRPRHEPLPSIEGCGLDFHRHCSLTSEDAAHGLASLDGGSGEGGSRGGTHKVGGPGGVTKHEPRRLSWFVFAIQCVAKTGYDICRSLFFSHSPTPNPPLTISNPT